MIVLSAEEAVTCADEQGQIQDELKWYRFFREKHTPVLFVINKADQDEENAARLAEMIYEEAKEDAVIISAKKPTGIEETDRSVHLPQQPEIWWKRMISSCL